MIRRIGVMSVLGAAWAWLAIAFVCGPVWQQECPAMPKSCCEQSVPAKPLCPADACALTCATVLIAQLDDVAFDVAPLLTAMPLADVNFRAAVLRDAPPVPPPRAMPA